MKVQKKIDIDKIYDFPNDLRVVEFKDKILVIAKETGNWIVLDYKSQLDFFNLLKKSNIKNALSDFSGDQKDAVYVVTQIEARQLYRKEVSVPEYENQLHFYLTNGCNLCCPHCYMFAGKKDKNELTTEEIKKFLKNYREYGQYVTFSGGEITTRKDLIEIIDFAKSCDYKIKLLTNGILWTDEMVKTVSSLIASVQISIDGYDEETNSKIRGKGNFEKALTCVEKFVRNNVKTEIAITPLYEKNFPIEKYVEFSKKLMEKFDNKLTITLAGEMLKGRTVDYTEDECEEYSDNAKKFLTMTTGANLDDGFISYHKNFEIHPNCNYGNYFIASNGDIYLCSVIEMMKPIGNIKNITMPEIQKIMEKARDYSHVDKIEPCRDCALEYICGGDCRIKFFTLLPECNFEKIESGEVPRRICNQNHRNKILDLMIRTNEQIFQ